MDSNSELNNTPPNIIEEANCVKANLFPAKFKLLLKLRLILKNGMAENT